MAVAKKVDGNSEGNDKRTKSGKFTLAQLRQTEGIVPLQSGTNQYDSQRVRNLLLNLKFLLNFYLKILKLDF